jgi:hypothetical protein
LAKALNQLRGNRSYAQIDRASGPQGLARSTLSNLLNGKSTATRETVVRFLTACGLSQDAQQPWLAAWERVATANLRRPPGAVRGREARPRLLGVHASIQVDPVATDLPPYVPRDLDEELRTAITAAAEQGGFVLLVGGSSVGKTRALFEAVREVLPEWWLTQPDPTEPDRLRALATEPTPRTVVWLDELQRYPAGPNGLSAGFVRDLVAAGVVLVATLWPHEYSVRTVARTPGRADPHANDRELTGLAHVIDVSETFSAAERHRAEALAGDWRIRIALDTPDAGFTQVLAAGPELVRWWEHAHDPYGKAVITAALDARRVGAYTSLSRDLLGAAAPAYLTSAQQASAPTDWLDQALSYATTQLRGATATLCPVAVGMGHIAGYTVSDFLYQHAERVRRTTPLPDVVWQALVDHHHPFDTFTLAETAKGWMRAQYAEALYRHTADTGDSDAARFAAQLLAYFLAEYNRVDEALTILDARNDVNNAFTAYGIAELLAEHGCNDEALKVSRFATNRLAELHGTPGRLADPEA